MQIILWIVTFIWLIDLSNKQEQTVEALKQFREGINKANTALNELIKNQKQ